MNIGKYKVKSASVCVIRYRAYRFAFGFNVALTLLEYFIVMIREPHTHSFFRIS